MRPGIDGQPDGLIARASKPEAAGRNFHLSHARFGVKRRCGVFRGLGREVIYAGSCGIDLMMMMMGERKCVWVWPVLYCTVLYCTVYVFVCMFSTLPYSIVQYNTLHYITLHTV